VGGAGGDGVQSSINGTATYYAGGGGAGSQTNLQAGGAGGLGGGGRGEGTLVNLAGTVNTGGGAGGMSSADRDSDTGLVGGSGIVIVRYPSTFTINIGAGLTGTTAEIDI